MYVCMSLPIYTDIDKNICMYVCMNVLPIYPDRQIDSQIDR